MEEQLDIAKGNNSPGFFQKAFFIIILLLSIHFWDLKLFPPLYNIYNLIVWSVCALGLMFVLKEDLLFKNAILLFILGIILNILASYINLKQSLYESFFSFSFYYFILIYFILHYFKFRKEFVENIVIIFAILYSIIFIIQFKVYPFVIFNNNAQTAIEEKQFEILGHGFLMIGYFLSLNRFLTTRKLFYMFLILLFFMVELKCGFRTLIVGAALMTALMVIRLFRFHPVDFIILFVIGILFMGLLQYKGVSVILDKMVTKTQSNLKEGDKYVRVIEREYYFKRYPKKLSYYIIGGGKPAGRNLYKYDYNRDTETLNYNIVWVDIGLLGFYIVVGGIALLGLLWYTLKAIFIKLPREFYYLNFYFFYLLIVSFTNEEIFRDGIFAVHAIGLYLIDLAVRERKELSLKNELDELTISHL